MSEPKKQARGDRDAGVSPKAASSQASSTPGKTTLTQGLDPGPSSDIAYPAGPGVQETLTILAHEPEKSRLADLVNRYPHETSDILRLVRSKLGEAYAQDVVGLARERENQPQRDGISMRSGNTKYSLLPVFGTGQKPMAKDRMGTDPRPAQPEDKPYDPIGDRRAPKEAPTQQDRKAMGVVDQIIGDARQQLADGGAPDGGTPGGKSDPKIDPTIPTIRKRSDE